MIVGIVSPSAPAAFRFPNRYSRAINNLRGAGLKVIESAHVSAEKASAQERHEDIVTFLHLPDLALIMSTIGGDNAMDILAKGEIPISHAGRKKYFIGYSDITAILAAALRSGHGAMYGPTLMTEFGDVDAPHPFSIESMCRALGWAEGDSELTVSWSPHRRVSAHDWSAEESTPRRASFDEQRMPLVTIRDGTATGSTMGGCLEVLYRLRGTPYWPDLDGAILLLESSSAARPELFHRFLTELRVAGELQRIGGLVIGSHDWPTEALTQVAGQIDDALRGSDTPAAMNFPFGHVSPITTLPLGEVAHFSATNGTLRFLKREE